MQEMIKTIKSSLMSRMQQLDWMDPETKKEALIKAEAIQDMIGYPDYILDKHSLDDKYKVEKKTKVILPSPKGVAHFFNTQDFEVVEGDYFGNTLNYHEYALKDSLSKLDEPVNKSR